jgi:DNA-binding PadR family transcriptional regulator
LRFEDEIINYLNGHGNTKESDLIEFGTYSLHLSSKVVMEGLDRMMKEGWIEHIMHTKLKTPAVYVRLKEPGLYALKQEWTELLKPEKRDKKTLHEEAQRILEEAAMLAEKRTKQKHPDTDKTVSS